MRKLEEGDILRIPNEGLLINGKDFKTDLFVKVIIYDPPRDYLKELTDLQIIYEQLNEKYETVCKEKGGVEDQLKSIKNQLSKYEGLYCEALSNLSNTNIELSETKKERDEITQQLLTVKEERDMLLSEREINDLERDKKVSELEKRNNILIKEKEELSQKIQMMKEDSKIMLNKKVMELEKEKKRFSDFDIEELRKKVKELEDDINEKDIIIKDLKQSEIEAKDVYLRTEIESLKYLLDKCKCHDQLVTTKNTLSEYVEKLASLITLNININDRGVCCPFDRTKLWQVKEPNATAAIIKGHMGVRANTANNKTPSTIIKQLPIGYILQQVDQVTINGKTYITHKTKITCRYEIVYTEIQLLTRYFFAKVANEPNQST
eukprot:NODE_3644_length_1313_cov_177.151261_g2899_i1.p1 GENE.NODE_3644_length_1313_cov_177.151261_g2899_i1~~NODE_3644_length_1313_cov_177.151261_g2899_i1.p1  ORF type:complete len:378 (+),score=60.91 NODE_3644_length_1313_cov_177.151261_g2899_i1:65-1198(+)